MIRFLMDKAPGKCQSPSILKGATCPECLKLLLEALSVSLEIFPFFNIDHDGMNKEVKFASKSGAT